MNSGEWNWLEEWSEAMVVEGVVRNGCVILDAPAAVADGTRVRVLVDEGARSTLAETLLKYAGTVNDLPSDMAAQHDHYLHGVPKQ